MDMENISVPKLLLKMSPPVMLALLIQSIYNIADSFFVARYSTEGLTALSIVYPVQLLITALATGTGAGVNILISRLDGRGETGRIFNCGDWKICVSCNFYQFCFCGTYNCYNFLLTGNCAYKRKSFYHCATSNCSSCSIGVGISFYRFKCSVVDISRYRDYCKYDRHIDNRDFA